jgi:single-strand selective monofunctional uracil DNA glycosylase
VKNLVSITDTLIKELRGLKFGPPVSYVYNPLEYAKKPYFKYLEMYGKGNKKVMLVGMNPGPWGMAQTGIPFGEVHLVKDWLGIQDEVGKPDPQHPKRPVLGFTCTRSEVSGQRLWGWARDVYRTPQWFFAVFFVANYCPLALFDFNGKNITPDKLRKEESKLLFDACDRALRNTVNILKPQFVIGVGNFAMKRAGIALEGMDVKIARITHPSPANPKANQGWQALITQELKEMGFDSFQ